MRSEIPAMVHPLGKHWDQPRKDLIELCGGFAIMELLDFYKLPEYSLSMPTGAYEGKMWKAKVRGDWLLCWYGDSGDPDKVSINYRLVIIRA